MLFSAPRLLGLHFIDLLFGKVHKRKGEDPEKNAETLFMVNSPRLGGRADRDDDCAKDRIVFPHGHTTEASSESCT